MPGPTNRLKLTGAALIIAGILFVLYPALRPFSDEASMQGAAAFASTDWLVSHMIAMVAFTLLGVGFLGVLGGLRGTEQEGIAFWSVVLGIVGLGLTMPFYGGEAYGLNAIGREAMARQSADLLSLASSVRSGAGLFMFLIGLLVLAISGVLVATALRKSDRYSQWTGMPLAIGLLLFIPQFFGSQPIRVAHGLLVAVGCVWIGVSLWRTDREP